MVVSVAVALGSNVGERDFFLNSACQCLSSHVEIFNFQCADFMESPAEGSFGQEAYLNSVCVFETTLSVDALFLLLRKIELDSGRMSKGDLAPRTLDLDLLFYGDLILSSDDLVLPHPCLQHRLFVLAPLVSLWPSFVHPLFKLSILELYQSFCDHKRLFFVSESFLSSFVYMLSSVFKPGDVVFLNGDLGAGKSSFCIALSETFGYTEASSPTFSLIHSYPTHPPILHLDLYRLNSDSEVEALDLERYFLDPSLLILIEWADRLPVYLMPISYFSVSISIVDDQSRIFTLEHTDPARLRSFYFSSY